MARKATAKVSVFERELQARMKLALDCFDAVRQLARADLETRSSEDLEIGPNDDYNSNGFLCYGCQYPAVGGKLYCDEPLCPELGGLVRYIRKGLAGDRETEADFIDGVGQKLLSALQGGYDPDRLLSSEARAAILERDSHTCVLCSKPGNHVDHIAGSSNSPSNLRTLCADCNTLRAFTPMVEFAEEPSDEDKQFQMQVWAEVVSRVASPLPLLALDRPDWQKVSPKILSFRRAAHREQLTQEEGDFEDVDGYLYHSMQKDD